MNAIAGQFLLDLLEVVDFAVEDDGVSGSGIEHRLMAGGAEIEDGQPAMAEGDAKLVGRGGRAPEARIVGAAVALVLGHRRDGGEDG